MWEKLSITNRVLFIIIFIGFLLRCYRLFDLIPFYGDQAWFYISARDSLFSGRLPLLGIPASITWLHQGPLWTYFLIPALPLFRFHPIEGNILTALLGTVCIPLLYYLTARIFNKKTAVIAGLIYAASNFSVINDRVAFDTSLIPLIFVLTLLLLSKSRFLLSGLFLGLLYQLHILSMIFWPFIIFWLLRKNRGLKSFFIGLMVGVLPFVIAGPVQMFGVVFWFVKFVFTRVPTTGISVAYISVLFIPGILAVSRLLSWIKPKALYILGIVFILYNLSFLYLDKYSRSLLVSGPKLSEKIILSRQILSSSAVSNPGITVLNGVPGVASYVLPYEYLTWYLQRNGVSPGGKNIHFIVDEQQLKFQVLK